MPRRIARSSSALCFAIFVPCIAAAQTNSGDESRWRIGAAFGYGERSNPLVQSEDVPIIVDLDIAWFGDRWFFDNGDGGLTLADTSTRTLNLIGRINSDRVFFGRTNTKFFSFDTATGAPLDTPRSFRPPDRDYAVELGLEMLTDGQWGAVQLQAFQDISGTHDGFEIAADYSFGWRRQRFYIEPSIGASYKSADLNNYYWGLTEAEGSGVVPAYEAGSGINWRTSLTVGYQVSRHWGFSLVAAVERLSRDVSSSPIVEESSVRAFFAGMAWRF